MELPRTDYDEALGAFRVPNASATEVTEWSLTADEQKNKEILRRVEEHMVIPKFSFAAAEPYAPSGEPNEYDAVANDILKYMSEPVLSEPHNADETLEAAPSQAPDEEINDYLAWAGLGHIRGLDPADPDKDHLAWNNLGHIKDHDAEVARQKEDDKLLRQTDFILVAKGLTQLLVRNDYESFQERTAEFSDAHINNQPVEDNQEHDDFADWEQVLEGKKHDDFDDWAEVLAANERTKSANREFWAETEIETARRARIRKIGEKAVAAAVAVALLVPSVGNFLSRFTGSKLNGGTSVTREDNNHRLSLVGGQVTIPRVEIPSTPSTTVKLENNVVTVTPAPEAATISLAEIVAQAKLKAEAEDLAKAEAAALAAAEAEAAKKAEKAPTLEEYLTGICGSANIRSDFGMRLHPIYGVWKMHTGIDIGCAEDAEIHAAKPGTVIQAGWNGGYGNSITVDHGYDEDGNHITTLYAHANYVSVHEGQEITDESLGGVGCTGDCTGTHMHTETLVNGIPVDPREVLGSFKR